MEKETPTTRHYTPHFMPDGQSVAYKLLAIIQHYAPDKAAQEKVAEYYNRYKIGKLQDKMMATALVDGLVYGNWPWTNLNELGKMRR